MKKSFIFLICLFVQIVVSGQQNDYYNPQDTLAQRQPKSKSSIKKEALCHCSATEGSTVWDDIWNTGIKGTIKSLWQSSAKPVLIGQAVGGVQEASKEAFGPTIAATTASSLAISEVNKSRKHHKKRKKKNNEFCDCEDCPYHGNKYKPAQGIQ